MRIFHTHFRSQQCKNYLNRSRSERFVTVKYELPGLYWPHFMDCMLAAAAVYTQYITVCKSIRRIHRSHYWHRSHEAFAIYRPLSIASTHIKLGFPARVRSKCEIRNYLTYPTAVAGECGGCRAVCDGDGGRAPDVRVTDERPRRVGVVAAHNDSINGDRLHPRPRRRRNRSATEHCNTVTIRSSAGYMIHVLQPTDCSDYAASLRQQTRKKPVLRFS